MEEKTTKKIGGKICIIVLAILLAISIAFSIFMIVQYNNKTNDKKYKDFKQLVSIYYDLNESLNYAKKSADILKEEWEGYIYDKKYSSLNDMYDSFKTKASTYIDLAKMYISIMETSYKLIKSDNEIYLKNSKIKENLDDAYNGYKEYYNFLFENEELSYITLSIQGSTEYTLCNTKIYSFLLGLTTLDVEVPNELQ